jgi:dTDP-L-rhamnose 4-epimerase
MSKGRVLVTGGAGFIGSHTVDALLAAGYNVRVLDNLSPAIHGPGAGWPVWLPADAERLRGDVRDREAWRAALSGVDAVFHLAAYQDLLPNFSEFFAVNAVGTALLFEVIVAERLPVRKVVLASSQFVYGEGRYHCPTDGEVFPPGRDPARLARGHWDPPCPACGGPVTPLPLLETHAGPANQYAIAKYTQELTALALGRNHGIPSVALRYSIVQGPRQSFRNAYSGALRVFTLQLLSGHRPTVFEDGGQLRDYVNIADIVRANLLALERPEADFHVFNVGGGRGYTVLELVRTVAAALGREAEPLLTGEYRVGDTRHSVSDISRLHAFGWRPTRTPADSAREYVTWVQRERPDSGLAEEALATMRSMGVLRRGDGPSPPSPPVP